MIQSRKTVRAKEKVWSRENRKIDRAKVVVYAKSNYVCKMSWTVCSLDPVSVNVCELCAYWVTCSPHGKENTRVELM